MKGHRYRAFISYSQKDRGAARRVHRWLETYRIPKAAAPGAARRLGRFFRDDDEMPASADLAASLRGALTDSENLIVICSPHAAQSRWVNAEITHFQSAGDSERIFAVICDGVPDSGDPATECFPPALHRRAASAERQLMAAEPLGVDLRKESRARICTKLAAGLLGLSFDDLWKREQRRRRRVLLQWSAASLLVAALLAVLVVRTIRTQQLARAQEREVQLASVSEAVGVNDGQALDMLRALVTEDGQDPAVGAVAAAILAWAKTPAETLAAFAAPRLWSSKNRLLLRTGAATSDIGDASPVRRLGFSGARILVVYRDRLVAVDGASGRVLDVLENSARADLSQHDWSGLALEARDGTGLVAGVHHGISNSQSWHSLVALSPAGKLSMLTPLEHPATGGDRWRSRFLYDVVVSPDCRVLGVLEASARDAGAAADRSAFLVEVADGARFGGSSTAMEGRTLHLLPPGGADGADVFWRIGTDRGIVECGCRTTEFDTLGRRTLTGSGGLILGADVAFSPAGPKEWTALPPADIAPVDRPALWEERPLARSGTNVCHEGSGGCQVVGGGRSNAETFFGTGALSLGWLESSMPPGGILPGSIADEFAARPLFSYHAQYNAGVESAWCRQTGSVRPACLTSWANVEYVGDWSDIDVRSRSGRFVYYSPGRVPFQVFDVQAMRDVTPADNQVVVRPGVAAFSDAADDRLFLFADNRLLVYEPAESGRFANASASLVWNRRLAGTDDSNPVAGLLGYGGDNLIAASSNGAVVRVAWRTGQVIWSRRAPGVGRVRAVRRSVAGEHVAVIGEGGIRLLRAQDGLLTSGVLIPPYLFDSAFKLTQCTEEYIRAPTLLDVLTDVTVQDDGQLVAQCGRARFAWKPKPYAGDAVQRVDALLKGTP